MDKSKSGDVEGVLALMTDDVVFCVAGRTFGKSEFEKGMASMKGTSFEGHSDIQEIEIAGDWAFVRSDLTVQAGGVTRRGPVLSIFRRGTDEQWRLARDANLLTQT